MQRSNPACHVVLRSASAALVALLMTMSPAAAGPGASDELPEGYAPEVADAAARALATEVGLSYGEALARLRSQGRRLAVGESLIGPLGPRAAGFWLDQKNDTVVVNLLDWQDSGVVEQAGAVPNLVSLSLERLDSIQAALASYGVLHTAVGVDVSANQVVLTVSDAASDPKLSSLLEEAESLAPAVRMEWATGEIELFLRGGDEISGSGSQCSAGFNVTGNGVLTAGHCTQAIPNWWVVGGQFLGPSINANFPIDDFGRIRNDGGLPLLPEINQYASGGPQAITGSANPTVGQGVCRSGRTSGVRCGTVTAVNVTVPYPQGPVGGLAQSTAFSQGGDSGGPWYAGSTALGLHSGALGTSPSFFQPVNEALSRYGVNLLVVVPTVQNVQVSPTPVYQGSSLNVSWSSTYQQRYEAYRCTTGGSCNSSPIFSGNPSGDQNATWTVPSNLAVGDYRIKVKVWASWGASAEAFSQVFTVLAAPTVQNVQVSPTIVYQGNPLNVSWSSTNQQRYEVFRCNASSPTCFSPPILAVDPSSAENATWNVPLNQAVGNFRLKVKVWAGSAFDEDFSPVFEVRATTITLRFSTFDTHPGEADGSIAPGVKVETTDGQNTRLPVTVSFVYTELGATLTQDFQPSGSSLPIGAGTPHGTIFPMPAIGIVQDALDEEDQEHFKITLTNPVNATLVQPFEHHVFIQDDDPLPTLGLSSCSSSLPEGHTGQTPCHFTISLSPVSGRVVSVHWATGGTATNGQDYTGGGSGSVTFAPGVTTRTVLLNILGDQMDEFDETVVMTLSAPANATVANGQATLTIIDDDPEPTLSVSDCSVTEGTGQQVNCAFVISLSAPSGKTVTVNWATADGTAVNGADYFGGSGTATFAPGTSTVTVPVGVIGDAIDEYDETAFLDLSAPTNATIPAGQGRGRLTIIDNDDPPALSVSNCAINEGHAGPSPCTFTVSLSAASGKPIGVSYATATGGGPYPATAADYTAASGPLSFSPGTTTRPLTVDVLGDVLDEFDETYVVNLSAPTEATIANGQGLGTILDDDPQPRVSLSDCTTPEGHTGYRDCVVTASLSAASGKPITLDLASKDVTAQAGSDYAARARDLTFAPGDTGETAAFPVRGDRVFEGVEEFQVDVRNPVNVDIEDGEARATIEDDDPAGFSMEDLGAVEGGNAVFKVTLSPPSTEATSVSYGTTDGTATEADGDYKATFGTLNFRPRQNFQIVAVPVAAGGGVEGVETLHMVLEGGVGAPIAYPEATATLSEPFAGRSFDADVTTDLLWRHGGTGDLVVWFMNDLALTTGSATDPAGVSDPDWNVAGTGDFNLDGQADVLWHHQVSGQLAFWLMDGVHLINGELATGVGDVSWRATGTGDFDRDGMTDLMWRHAGSNQLSIWYLDGTELREGLLVVPTLGWPDPGWSVAGTGDFNRDGKVDVLWRHTQSGQLAVWYLDNNVQTGGEFLDPSSLASMAWELRSTRDLDRDGQPDLLWRHNVSGELVGWLMDGIILREGRYLSPPSLPDLGWSVVGPR